MRDQVEVAVCPPAVYLFPLAEAIRGSQVRLGAQDVYHEPSGAFTGRGVGGNAQQKPARGTSLSDIASDATPSGTSRTTGW